MLALNGQLSCRGRLLKDGTESAKTRSLLTAALVVVVVVAAAAVVVH